jgi:hypothetical protein
MLTPKALITMERKSLAEKDANIDMEFMHIP